MACPPTPLLSVSPVSACLALTFGNVLHRGSFSFTLHDGDALHPKIPLWSLPGVLWVFSPFSLEKQGGATVLAELTDDTYKCASPEFSRNVAKHTLLAFFLKFYLICCVAAASSAWHDTTDFNKRVIISFFK